MLKFNEKRNTSFLENILDTISLMFYILEVM